MPTLSVIVPTFNEEKNIDRALTSAHWADEIVVVDSFSTDRTCELARRFTDRILQFEYPGYSRQVERGIAAARGEWIFILDADEEISPELGASIRSALGSSGPPDGYEVNRKVSVLGKWIEHCGWSPDWQFRLMKKSACLPLHHEVHGAFTTRGSRGRLEGFLYHYTYATIEQYLEKMNDYTSLHVSNKLEDSPEITVPWHKIVLSPLSYFLRMFVVNKGYKDGMHGFILSVYSAFYTLLTYSKTWEYRRRRGEGKGFLPPITNAELREVKKRYR